MRRVLAFLVCLLIPAQAFAAAAHRSDSATTYASRTNTTCTAPAGIADGDVLLIVFDIAAATSAPTPTAPSGFVAVSGTYPINILDSSNFNVGVYVWYKIASGEAGNYTVTHSTASSQCYMKAVSGGSSSQPASTTNSGSSSPTVALTITPAGNDALVMFVSSDWADTANALSPPTGTTPTFTERLDTSVTAGLLYVADGVLATAGATGNKSITNNSGVNGMWGGVLVVVEASGGAAAETFGFRKRLPQ